MFVTEKELARANSWIEKFSNKELLNQFHMFEAIIDFDEFNDFIFSDEIIELHRFMLEECAIRLADTIE